MKRPDIVKISAALLLLLLLPQTGVLAAGTEFYRYSRLEDYGDSNFRGLIMEDSGSWRLGRNWEEVLADELAFFTEMGDDGRLLLLAGGGSPGKLILFEKGNGRHHVVHSEENLLFSCVEVLGEGRFAVGSGPGGKVFLVEAGEYGVELLTDTGQDFIWDLCRQGDNLWIATGSGGEIYRYDLSRGESELFHTLPDQGVFSLTIDQEGRLLAGTSGEGLLYRFERDGEVTLLADFEAEEIQQIVTDDQGMIYLAVAQIEEECTENCAAVYRLEPGGLLEKMLSSDSAFIGDLLLHAEGGLWVASGNPAELDILTDLYSGRILGLEEGVYYNDLSLDGETLWLLQSKPSRLIKISGQRASAPLTSEVLDLTSRSRAGSIHFEGEFRDRDLEVEARCGQSSEPGEGWSRWQKCERQDESGRFQMNLPVARYLQWRATLQGTGTVDRVNLSYLPLNRTPLIGNLMVLRPTDGPFEDGLELVGRPFTQVLERGVRVQYQQKGPVEPAGERADAITRGLRQINWDWLDPDGDRLRARIEYQGENGDSWQLLTEELTRNIYTWDTRGMPDGKYRVRITADDTLDNGKVRTLTMSALSRWVVVDSSPPRFDLKLKDDNGELRLKGVVRDHGGGIVTVIESRLDGGPWLPQLPADTWLLDRSEARLDLHLTEIAADGLIELRARDEYGNWGYFRHQVETGDN
jgi:hypothetical protein